MSGEMAVGSRPGLSSALTFLRARSFRKAFGQMLISSMTTQTTSIPHCLRVHLACHDNESGEVRSRTVRQHPGRSRAGREHLP